MLNVAQCLHAQNDGWNRGQKQTNARSDSKNQAPGRFAILVGNFTQFSQKLRPTPRTPHDRRRINIVHHEDDADVSNAGLVYFPLSSGLNEQAVRAQVKSQGGKVFEMQDRKSKSIDAKCNDRKLEITHEIGIEGDWEHHLYYTVLPGNDGNTLLVVKTERPLEGSKAADQEREGRPVFDYFIDSDAVKKIVESFSPAQPED